MSESNVFIRYPEESDAAELAALYRRNRAFFELFSPAPGNEFYTEEHQLESIRTSKAHHANDTRYSFVICLRADESIIGSIGLSFVARGVLQSCMAGFNLDQAHNGKGYMTEALRQVVRYAFEELRFHRITGEASPRNPGSIRTMEKAGFHKEGIARRNVKINGVWEDHQVMAILNPSEDI
ncbi:GNAT family N-acetyltransferase [Paenibacillus albicereus]|uniref:GNAT family N-acetyltransferase n=1 Tax=Paenibacillus albicereus TaxID=2726185 RepID=A0A6H2GTG4_9BACL|nr:GNAT family protein [Paenibacillus albicereus]QJC50714.1 GNAT family N-acetyltransferase [Paenibacillus albicereus]